jgi:uncharacterized membrane protein YbaN (DUF454 family)/predicted small lipoprotein YifL
MHAANRPAADAPARAQAAKGRRCRPRARGRFRWAWWLLAYASLGTGIVGIFVPGLPTTVFILISAWAASRGSAPALPLAAAPRFGPAIANWQATARSAARQVDGHDHHGGMRGIMLWCVPIAWVKWFSIGSMVVVASGCGRGRCHHRGIDRGSVGPVRTAPCIGWRHARWWSTEGPASPASPCCRQGGNTGRMKRIPIPLAAACAAVLSACGNKGPLVLPQKPVDVPATPAPRAARHDHATGRCRAADAAGQGRRQQRLSRSTALRFSKMHGAGNDFVVIDLRDGTPAHAELAARLADRHTGVGCDQILTIEPPRADGAVAAYRIWNADGSNSGSAATARAASPPGWCAKAAASGPRFVIDSPLASHEVEVLGAGRYVIDMGVPAFEPATCRWWVSPRAGGIPAAAAGRAVRFGAVSMGNPHAVIEVADVDAAPVERVGAAAAACRRSRAR